MLFSVGDCRNESGLEIICFIIKYNKVEKYIWLHYRAIVKKYKNTKINDKCYSGNKVGCR